ncbi:RNA-guided endonuclease InsQ/TnpB family protein [Glycomyces buryatensis]|uniref:Transposase n=1 Tax=Glycomyces buryatensis TaxID=2570927 RepID=A0A4S8QFD5_9ACTN|nr:transposase [Glycomyces buryatensis]
MARFRMYPTGEQEWQLLLHCAQARYVWNLAVEQRSYWARHKGSLPGYVELARQLTEARAASEWLREGNAEVQQQALRDFDLAVKRRFDSGFGEPSWRKRYRHEGFRVIGSGRVPEFEPDGSPKLNRKGKQVMARSVVVQKLNKRWAQVKVPGCGWVRFRLTRRDLPAAKTFRVTWRRGQWHVAFAIVPEPVTAPGTGEVVGVDRGVKVTAALSDGRMLNCPQLNSKERARLRKHERRASRAPKDSPQKRAEHAKAAKIKATEADRRKDWCEKTSTMLASGFDVIRFEKLNIKTMTASAKGTAEAPGKGVAQKTGLNRAILAQGWGLLRRRTEQKAPGRVEDVPAPYTSLRCSDCGWIEKNSRKSQAEFSCVSCGFTCNADVNAANNVAAGQGGIPRPRSSTGAGGTTARQGSSVREPQRPPPQ